MVLELSNRTSQMSHIKDQVIDVTGREKGERKNDLERRIMTTEVTAAKMPAKQN